MSQSSTGRRAVDPNDVGGESTHASVPVSRVQIGEQGPSKFDLLLEGIERLLRRGAITNLTRMLGKLHPADIAKVITHLSVVKDKRTIFELVRGEKQRGLVLSELDADSITAVLADLQAPDLAWLLKDQEPDDVAYILGVLPEERAQDVLALMKAEVSTEVAGILQHPKDTAGGIMTTEFFRCPTTRPRRRRSIACRRPVTPKMCSTSTSGIVTSAWWVSCLYVSC